MKANTRWLILITTALLFLDQLIKSIVSHTLEPGQSIPFIPSIMDLSRVHNTGVAFGLFANAQLLMGILAVAIVTFLIIKRHEFMVDTASTIALGLIIGGAIGNLIDRVVYGYVIDYLNLGWWPAFNIADVGVVIGGLLLLFVHLRLSLNNSRRIKTKKR